MFEWGCFLSLLSLVGQKSGDAEEVYIFLLAGGCGNNWMGSFSFCAPIN